MLNICYQYVFVNIVHFMLSVDFGQVQRFWFTVLFLDNSTEGGRLGLNQVAKQTQLA